MSNTTQLSASFRLIYLFDIGEAVRLDEVRISCGADQQADPFPSPAPPYAGFENPPVVGTLEHLPESAEAGFWKLFDYGVLCIEWEIPFEGTWADLVVRSRRFQEAQSEAVAEAEKRAREITARLGEAVEGPYESWLNEDYLVLHIEDLAGPGGARLSAEELIAQYGAPIAQLVRGEYAPLSARERDEVLSARLSCYDSDLLVAGWAAALVYEPRQAALVTMQLLEHANAQLLEFRHYDAVLDGLLKRLYRVMETSSGLFRKWTMARQAEHLNALRLEVMELTERSEHSLRFLGDMYYARAYRVAAQKIGVDDYKGLVAGKLRTAGELYQFLIEEFHQQRTFLLEVLVVVILVVELWDVLFRH
ncbi:MAG TPA: hypothetical protein VGL53_22740 [Bryobacteraceae bacterium]|jgi:hypothetical protein